MLLSVPEQLWPDPECNWRRLFQLHKCYQALARSVADRRTDRRIARIFRRRRQTAPDTEPKAMIEARNCQLNNTSSLAASCDRLPSSSMLLMSSLSKYKTGFFFISVTNKTHSKTSAIKTVIIVVCWCRETVAPSTGSSRWLD